MDNIEIIDGEIIPRPETPLGADDLVTIRLELNHIPDEEWSECFMEAWLTFDFNKEQIDFVEGKYRDYCKGKYIGLPKTSLQKLKIVQLPAVHRSIAYANQKAEQLRFSKEFAEKKRLADIKLCGENAHRDLRNILIQSGVVLSADNTTRVCE